MVNHDTLSRIGELGQRDSNLDLVWCNSAVADMIGCQIGEDSLGSDHYPIFFEYNLIVKVYVKKTNRITSKCTDWSMYIGILIDREEEISGESLDNMNEEDKYTRIVDIIKKAAFEATGEEVDVNGGKGYQVCQI